MPGQRLAGDRVQAHAADPRRRAAEILVDHFAGQAHGLELLRRMVAAQRGDAHLGHRLEDALLDGRDVLVAELIGARLGGRSPSSRRRWMASKAR